MALRRARPRPAQVLRGRPPRGHGARPADAPPDKALVHQSRLPARRLDTPRPRRLRVGGPCRAASRDSRHDRGRPAGRLGRDRRRGGSCPKRCPGDVFSRGCATRVRAYARAPAIERHNTRTVESAGWRDGLAFGLAQSCALIPGVSRNGATIATARARGFSRLDADRLSWQAGLPVIAAATALKGLQLTRRGTPPELRAPFAAGATGSLLGDATQPPLCSRRPGAAACSEPAPSTAECSRCLWSDGCAITQTRTPNHQKNKTLTLYHRSTWAYSGASRLQS